MGVIVGQGLRSFSAKFFKISLSEFNVGLENWNDKTIIRAIAAEMFKSSEAVTK